MKYLILLALVFSFGVALASDPIYGCTNKQATNYNPLATVDNGTCYIRGGGNPLNAYQPLWGMSGFEISQKFVSLRPGERFGNAYCPSWMLSSGCWTLILK